MLTQIVRLMLTLGVIFATGCITNEITRDNDDRVVKSHCEGVNGVIQGIVGGCPSSSQEEFRFALAEATRSRAAVNSARASIMASIAMEIENPETDHKKIAALQGLLEALVPDANKHGIHASGNAEGQGDLRVDRIDESRSTRTHRSMAGDHYGRRGRLHGRR